MTIIALNPTHYRPPVDPLHTPWGRSQSRSEIAPGIVHHETGSHGGMFVSDELLAQIPAPWRAYAAKWTGSENWFEEDVAWAAVAVTFPQHFPTETLTLAKRIAGAWLPKLEQEA